MSELDEALSSLRRKVDMRMEQLLIKRSINSRPSSQSEAKLVDETESEFENLISFETPALPLTDQHEPLIANKPVTARTQEAEASLIHDEIQIANVPALVPEVHSFFSRLLSRFGIR